MKFAYVFFIPLFITFSSVHSQTTAIDTVINGLQKDQLLFEKVFIHTNKTSYLNDDVIWFKAYVSTNDNRPSLRTTLLYVNLFTKSGKLLGSKNILINKGIGQGQFQLSGDLVKGKYYIQAFTNYMQNFGEQNKYTHEINISNKFTTNEAQSSSLNYDLQVFPEGGFLLENANNTIGVKALINGRGFDYKGKIVDSKNLEVASFKNEHLGMGKCSFFYKELERYEAIFNINDSIIKVEIPRAKRSGLILNLLNSEKSDVINIELQTNTYSINKGDNNYTLLFHQNNKLIDYAKFSFLDTSKVKLEIKKASLYNGVNSVTVFKNEKPILERKFFNYYKKSKSQITNKKITNPNGSLAYKLSLNEISDNAYLSVSVLPEIADYKQNSTIESAFLLTPYIRGYIEHPAYYFNVSSKERFKKIDLLMLTQGWVGYTTKEYIEKLNPTYKYDFELGYNLSGKVSPLKSNNLGVLSKGDQVITQSFLNGKTTFEFKNLLVFKGDSIKVSFLLGKDRNKVSKPRNIYFDTVVKQEFKFPYVFQENYIHIQENKIVFKENLQEEQSLNLRGVTALENVNLKAKKKDEAFLREKAFFKKYGVFDSQILEIDEKYVNANKTLEHFLRKSENVTVVNWKGVEDYLTDGIRDASLVVDKKRISSELLRRTLSEIEMEDIEAMLYKRNTHHISYVIFTTDNYKKRIKELFKQYIFDYGYDKSKIYYTPLYSPEVASKDYEIDWKPNLRTNKKGEVVFEIKENNSANRLLFSVQGFTENGKLISELIKVN